MLFNVITLLLCRTAGWKFFVNPSTSTVKLQLGDKSLLTFDSMDRVLKCDHFYRKATEQYLSVVLFVFQFYAVCTFGKLDNFRLGTVSGVNAW